MRDETASTEPMNEARPPGWTTPISTTKDFVLSRWRGDAPLTTVFWRDMMLAGSIVNVLTLLAMMALLAAGVPIVIGLLVFFTPLPLNLFLFTAVWRCAEHSTPLSQLSARLGAAVWLTAAILL